MRKTMKKKYVLILVILTNVFSVSLVLLFLNSNQPQKEIPAIVQTSNKESDQAQKAQDKPKQTVKMQIDSIISHYDTIKSGRYREFMDKYKLAIRKDPPYTAKSTIGYFYAKSGDYEKAIRFCEENIKKSFSPADFYTLAWINAKIGKYEKAIAVSKKAILRNPDYPKIWHLLGWVYAKLGEHDKAVQACNSTLKLDPHSALSHYGLGRIYIMLGKPEKAIESYKQAVQLQSDFVEAYLFLGLTYAELGDHEKAIDAYSEAVFIDRHYPEVHFFLGVAYDEFGQYKKAIGSYEAAITWYNTRKSRERISSLGIKPDMATINCIIGVCRLRLGQKSKAAAAFKNSINIDDSHAGAHYGLAIAYFLLDQKEAAVGEYEAVKTLKGEEMAKPLFDIIQQAGNLEKQ